MIGSLKMQDSETRIQQRSSGDKRIDFGAIAEAFLVVLRPARSDQEALVRSQGAIAVSPVTENVK
jgi:hypothetical protein